MSRLRHPNILTLVGYCVEHGQRLLVYEYMGNRNLHDMLHFAEDSGKMLSWNARVRIALGTARALEYVYILILNFLGTAVSFPKSVSQEYLGKVFHFPQSCMLQSYLIFLSFFSNFYFS